MAKQKESHFKHQPTTDGLERIPLSASALGKLERIFGKPLSDMDAWKKTYRKDLEFFESNDVDLKRLQEAKKLKLIGEYSGVSHLCDLARLSEKDFVTLRNLVLRYGVDQARGFIIYEKTLPYFRPEHPLSPVAYALMDQGDAALAQHILFDPHAVRKISDQPDPLAWVNQRYGMLRRLIPLKIGTRRGTRVVGIGDFDKKKAFIESDERNIESLERIQDPEMRSAYLGVMVELNEPPEIFCRRIATWDQLMTPGLLKQFIKEEESFSSQPGIKSLFRSRLSWIEALLEQMTSDALRESLSKQHGLQTIAHAEQMARIHAEISATQEAEWNARETVEIQIEEGSGVREEELRDFLRLSGFETIIKRCVGSIFGIPRGESQGAIAGDYMRLGGQMTLVAARTPEARKYFPGTVIHETGHGTNFLLGGKSGGQAAFDRYAVQIFFGGPHKASSYPEAIEHVRGRDEVYLKESFAEDFFIFLTYPPLLPEKRLAHLKELFHIAFPDVDLEKLRKNIRQSYATLYGTNVKEVQRPTNCQNIARLANLIDRMHSERRRDKANKKKWST